MVKKVIVAMLSAWIMLPVIVSAQDEVASENGAPLKLIRTTVYDGPSDHTATGRKAEYGIVAYDPAYYGMTCILYTEDLRYIGIFECQDTGGYNVRTGKVLDVYCPNRQACYDWVAENGEYCYVQWIDAEG